MKEKTTLVDKQNTKIAEDEASFLLKLCHELKSPIHGIGGISAYLCDNWDQLDDKTRRKSVAAIYSANKNLSKLVDSLLKNPTHHNEIKFNFVKLDLVEATKSIVNIHKNLYINKNTIKVELQGEIDRCLSIADPFWYGQLLTNLLANSINYSKQGTITIRFFIDIIGKANNFIVYVRDEGIGIPETELNTIFTPFNRGSRGNMYSNGTGLGLSICREIVEAHNGIISASNNKKVGSTFKFALPIKIK